MTRDDWQMTVSPVDDRLFAGGPVSTTLTCPTCMHAADYLLPGVVDWRDRAMVEHLRANVPATACQACAAPIEVRRPVVVLRPGDPIGVLVALPEDSPLDKDMEILSELMRDVIRPAGATLPARLDHIGRIADRYSGFALAQIDVAADLDDDWTAWLEAIRTQVEVPPLNVGVNAFAAATGSHEDAVAGASEGLLNPDWAPVVDELFTRLRDDQSDAAAAEAVQRRLYALRRLRSGVVPPSNEETLPDSTRQLLDAVTSASAASAPDRPERLRELIDLLRSSPDHGVLLVATMISYAAAASSPPWRTPESLARAIEVGAEAMELAATVFGPAHHVTVTAIQDHAAVLLDQQAEPTADPFGRAMTLFRQAAVASIASLDRMLSDVLQNWASTLIHHTAGGRTDNQVLAISLYEDALHVHRVLRPLDVRGALVIRLNTAAARREGRSGNVLIATRLAVRTYREILHDAPSVALLGEASTAQASANFVTALYQLRSLDAASAGIEEIAAAAETAAAQCRRLTGGDPIRIRGLSNIGSVLGDLYQETYKSGTPRDDLLDLGLRLTGEANDDAVRWLGAGHDERIRVGQNHVANLARPRANRPTDVAAVESMLRDLLIASGPDHLTGHRYHVAVNLARLYAGAGRWADSIECFEIAIEAVHRLYGQAQTPGSQLAELGVAADVAGWLTVLHLMTDDIGGALNALERSRARLLAGRVPAGPATQARHPVLYIGVGSLASWIILLRPNASPIGLRTRLTSDELRPFVIGLRTARNTSEIADALDAIVSVLDPPILGPVRLLLDEERITDLDVVTSGLLSGLPIHALAPDAEPGLTWLARATIRHIPSRTVAATWPAWSLRGGPLLAYADRASDLDCAMHEPAMIPAALGAMLPEPDSGDRVGWLLESLRVAGQVHLACHARWNPDDPLTSTIQLAADREVTLSQLLDVSCDQLDLAVLSCCSSGVPVETLSDELLGFGTGMLLAGARATIVSSWDIDDLAASLVMARFYQQLGAAVAPDLALRTAQLWVASLTVDDLEALYRESTSGQVGALLPVGLGSEVVSILMRPDARPDAKPFRHPAHWAGYSYHGPSSARGKA